LSPSIGHFLFQTTGECNPVTYRWDVEKCVPPAGESSNERLCELPYQGAIGKKKFRTTTSPACPCRELGRRGRAAGYHEYRQLRVCCQARASSDRGRCGPLNRDNDTLRGKRQVWRRAPVRAILYMATLVATKCNPVVRSFYLRLRGVGKAPNVVLVACMRKILTILNAMMKHRTPWRALVV
jgi:hypothetical protein